ncbi:MAG TPA: hypothetical protein VMF88_04360 [Bacteroidota bacterium]|nr:hypothetical protein [Bacteroidota bacterium]
MTYRVSVYKYLEVPKTVAHDTVEGTEAEAIARAKESLLKSDGDVVVVALVTGGETRVVQRFEKVKKAS